MSAREVQLSDWGKVLLEEVLFAAAAATGANPGDGIAVQLTFRLTADGDSDALRIAFTSAVDGEVVTLLPRPF